MDLRTLWDLAKRWFEGRDRREWRPRTAAEAEAVFREVGLEGDFWRTAGSESDGSS